MNIPLGKRNLDALVGEGFIDGDVKLVEDTPSEHRFFHPAKELEVQGGVAERPETDPRGGTLADLRVLLA